jgi:N-acetylglutamate synthase-like GNAT family acetyltransferase
MQEDKSTFIAELEVGASYASLMSATSLFFTGILISQYKSFSATIKVPLIYLIISTFSFIFAATIYSNAGSELTLNRMRAVEKYMIYAKNIVELMGLYLFILAVPLVIGAVTQDSFLRTSTIVIAIVGFTFYSQSKFSILEKELSPRYKRYLSTVVVLLALLLYYTQSRSLHHSLVAYSSVSLALLVIIVAATALFSLRSKQYKPVVVRPFKTGDTPSLTAILQRNAKVKVEPHLPSITQARHTDTVPNVVSELARDNEIFVAEFDGKPVGMVCLKVDTIASIVIDPAIRRRGVGRTLVEYVENRMTERDIRVTQVYATPLEKSFYVRLGYEQIKETKDADGDAVTLMKKGFTLT